MIGHYRPTHYALIASLAICVVVMGQRSASAETIDYIKERRELIVCVSPRAEPYSDAILMIERPKYPGIQIDLANELAKKIGVGVKYSWLNFFLQADKVKCDLFMGVPKFKNETPHPFLKKSVSYYSGVKDIFVATKNYKLKGLKDFKGLRVAADTSTLAQDILRKQNSGAELFVSYIEDTKKLDALKKGEIDIALVTNISLGWYQHDNPDFKEVITTPASIIAPNKEYDFALGLHKADEKTIKTFNTYLQELIADGTVKKIFNHYGIDHQLND